MVFEKIAGMIMGINSTSTQSQRDGLRSLDIDSLDTSRWSCNEEDLGIEIELDERWQPSASLLGVSGGGWAGITEAVGG